MQAAWEGIMHKAIVALACAVFVAGCASASGTMLSADTAIISSEGTGPADREKVIRDALSEAARLTSANGYRYFVVLTADDLTHTVTVRTPGRQLYQQAPRSAEGTFGTYAGRAYAVGGSTYQTPDRVQERIKPAMDIIIRMYRAGDIEPAEGVFDAAAMLAPGAPR
jgi:hypothetical protein